MCRILAYSGSYDIGARKVVQSFPLLAKNGDVPVGFRRGHSEGWGCVGYKKGERVYRHRNTTAVYKDDEYVQRTEQLIQTMPDIIITHARKATIGQVLPENNHPFIDGKWSFCHNGSFFQSQNLPLEEAFQKKVQGTTDTEKFFFFFLQLLKHEKDESSASVRNALKRAIRYLRKNLEYTALNLFFTDGTTVWALREVSETDRLVKLLKLSSYFSLYWGQAKNVDFFVVSSEQLKLPNITWKSMKNHECIEYHTKKHTLKSYSFA